MLLIQSPGEENSMANLAGVVRQLQKQRAQAARELERLDAALVALNGAGYGKRTGTRRRMSAAGRRRIKLAQAKRWAKWRKARASKN